MTDQENPTTPSARCWQCASTVPLERLDVEAVLRVRSATDGGPYREWRCVCGVDSGALVNAAGAWLLYPLEGQEDPDLIERLIPRYSRARQDAAVAWWRRNAAAVERFRRDVTDRPTRSRPSPGPDRTQRPPPRPKAHTQKKPPPRAKTERRSPRSEQRRSRPAQPEIRPDNDVDRRSPHELLGIEKGATDDEIGRAYRKALKLCHPDRVANLDADIQDLAHRKAKALRRAYEQLLNPG